MKLIAGLGNPGEKHKNNRHNVGMRVVDKLVEKRYKDYGWTPWEGAHVCKAEEVVIAKPMSYFMNESGEWVKKLKNFYKIENHNIVVVYDDLDLEMGRVLVTDRGPKIHNGLNSIITAIGETFLHVRCGVDDRGGDRSLPGSEYVLRDFPNGEELNKLIEIAVMSLENLL